MRKIDDMSMILKPRDFLVFMILSYAVVVSGFIDAAQRNYLVLFAATLGGLLVIVLNLPLRLQAFLAFIMFLVMALRNIFLGGIGELGSVALTFVYASGYFAIGSLLERVHAKRAFVQSMIRKVIYAFAVVSAIQMVASLAGVPIPNLIESKGLWSYNSLAYEPSQLGRIVGISMLCYLMLERLPDSPAHSPDTRKTCARVMASFISTMILSGSALAAIAILFVFVLSRSPVWIAFIAAVSILVWPAILVIDLEPVNRAALLISNLGSLDLDQVLEADHSGGMRAAPLLVYLEDFAAAEFGFWFGYGSDGLPRFLLNRIPGLGDQIATGFVPGFSIVYGVITTLLFVWIFAFYHMSRTTWPLIVFWLMFFTSSAWNTQVFWYGLIVIQIAATASRATVEPRRVMSS